MTQRLGSTIRGPWTARHERASRISSVKTSDAFAATIDLETVWILKYSADKPRTLGTQAQCRRALLERGYDSRRTMATIKLSLASRKNASKFCMRTTAFAKQYRSQFPVIHQDSDLSKRGVQQEIYTELANPTLIAFSLNRLKCSGKAYGHRRKPTNFRDLDSMTRSRPHSPSGLSKRLW